MDRTVFRRFIGSAIVVILLPLAIAGLQFYGVINAPLGRLCFLAMFIIGVGGIIFSEWIWNQEVRTKIFVGVVGIAVWGACMMWLDGWARLHGTPATPAVQSSPQPLAEKPAVSRDPIVRFPANVQIVNPSWELSIRPPTGTTVEVQYVNGGPATAKNLRAGADAIFGYDLPNEETEDRLFTQFIKKKNSFGPPSDLIPETKSWLHRFIPELSGNEMAELENGRRSLIVVGALTYVDPTGSQRRAFCYSFIPIAETKALPQGEDPLKKHWRACQPKLLKRWQDGSH